MTDFRIGQGVDIHPFKKGRKLFLGGVEIPGAVGLQGHSDADALIHAIVDAILGALAKGDIGQHFPDTDPKYKGRSSVFFLQEMKALLLQEGWRISNIDGTVITEEPILRPHIEPMRRAISETLGIRLDQISVKATRPEELGALGRKEGLMAMTSVLLSR